VHIHDPNNFGHVVEKVVFHYKLQKFLKDKWREDAEEIKDKVSKGTF
jgi:hypothetical protein